MLLNGVLKLAPKATSVRITTGPNQTRKGARTRQGNAGLDCLKRTLSLRLFRAEGAPQFLPVRMTHPALGDSQ